MSISGRDVTAAITARYLGFAAEARGRSAQYEELAIAVAGDSLTLRFLGSLPAAKRQLNASWLSNGGPDVLPGIAVPDRHDEKFVLVRDGTRAVALTDAHGTWIDWLP
jgi:hypothetical protein